MSELGITVNGIRYAGWETVSVNRSIEHISGGFEISVSELEPDDPTARAFRPGLACTVDLDGDVVITGHLDDVGISYDSGKHDITLAGRDATGDLVDCSADHKPGEWKNLKLEAIVAALCKPFGISVHAETDTGKPIRTFTLNDGEEVFAAIDRLCRFRAVLPVSDGLGSVVLTRAGDGRATGALVYGENIKAGTLEASNRDRFSVVKVRGQGQKLEGWAVPASTEPQGQASDGAVGRHRPKIIVPDLQADGTTFSERAKWEVAVRAGRARRLTYTVQGWRDAGGDLWKPNTTVTVDDKLLGASGNLLISTVEFARNDRDGSQTVLTLARKAAFELLAVSELKPGDELWTP